MRFKAEKKTKHNKNNIWLRNQIDLHYKKMESNGGNATTENGATNDTASSSTMNQDEQIMLQKQVNNHLLRILFLILK